MNRTIAIALCVGVVALASAGETPKELTFAKADVGKAPSGWTIAKTGTGEGSVWTVMTDETAPSKTGHVLAQTAAGPTQVYNLCVVEDSSFKDGAVSVAVKAVKGKIDQGGGLLWRYKDANNYYVCRYNPLEANFRLYTVKAGKRVQLATKEEVELPEEKWFTVSIKHTGKAIECSLNGKKLLEVADETFPDTGKVGAWTKADAMSHFDQFRYTPSK